jgi:integrase
MKPKTFADYGRALRLITAGVAGIGSGKEKFGPNGAKRSAWLQKINGASLSELTLERVQRWKLEFPAKAGQHPMQKQTRARSANSLIRQAKSLFARKRLKFVSVKLPTPLPFAGIEMEKEGSHRYTSRFDVREVIQAANAELAQSYPEQFKAFLLAVGAGFRRNEIDKLEWTAVSFDTNSIFIAATEFLSPKSHDSEGEVAIDPEFMSLLRGYHADATGRFVVESHRAPRTGTSYTDYRCKEHFDALLIWLRHKGVSERHPLHGLRKEFGSLINEQHGIHAASRALRHAEIGITAKYYLDNRKRVTPGLGDLLKFRNSTAPLPENANSPASEGAEAAA